MRDLLSCAHGVAGLGFKGSGFRVWGLPKGSYVVPFWVCYGSAMVFLVTDYNILPKKELHRRVWVEFRFQGLGFRLGTGVHSLGESFRKQSWLQPAHALG